MNKSIDASVLTLANVPDSKPDTHLIEVADGKALIHDHSM